MSADRRTSFQARPNRSLYDRLGGVYDRLFDPFEGPLREQAIRLLDARPGEEIVELGTGTGRALTRITEQVGERGRVVGMDLSRGMLTRASRRMRRSHAASPWMLVRARLPLIPLAPASVHATFVSFTLELFEPEVIAQVLSEVRRVLRPAGRLAVVSLSKSLQPGLMERGYTYAHRLAPSLIDCCPMDVDRLLSQTGFALRHAASRSLAGIPVRLILAVPA